MNRNSRPVPASYLGTIQDQLTYGEYAALDAINAHGLMDVLDSPATYLHGLARESTPSPSMALGLDLDACLLEPDLFAQSVTVRGDPEPGNRRQVTQLHWNKIQAMADAVRRNRFAVQLLDGKLSQPTVCWKDRFHGVDCKARLDLLTQLGNRRVAVDLKTARAPGAADFSRAAANFRYDLQAAHYLEGGRATGQYDGDVFFFIVVGNTAPHECFVYQADDGFIANGTAWRDHAMQLYAQARRANEWPGKPEFATLSLPRWAGPPQEEESAPLEPDAPPDDLLEDMP